MQRYQIFKQGRLGHWSSIKVKLEFIMADGDKDKVKVSLEWPISQAMVTQINQRTAYPESRLIHARKRGCANMLTFKLQLVFSSRSQYGNYASVQPRLHLVKGYNATVSWCMRGHNLYSVNFTPTSGKTHTYNQSVTVIAETDAIFDFEVSSIDWIPDGLNTEALKEDLTKLLKSGDLSDVTLTCEDKQFQAHKSILAARSSVFRAMLTKDNGFKEGRAGKECKITIEEADPVAFENFLTFLYGGEFDQDDMDLTLALLELGERYDVQVLKDVCSESLTDSLTDSNYWMCLSRCAKLNVPDLVKEAVKKAVENPKEIRDNDGDWLQLIKQCPELTIVMLDVFQEKMKK